MNGAKRKKNVCIYVARIANNTLKHLSTLSACCNLLGHTYTRIHTPKIKKKTNKKLFFLLLFLFNFNRIAAIINFFPFSRYCNKYSKIQRKATTTKMSSKFQYTQTHTHTHTPRNFSLNRNRTLPFKTDSIYFDLNTRIFNIAA